MSRNRKLAKHEFDLEITDLLHDGRGVGRLEGKAVFVTGALPGETVRVRQTGRNRHFDEGETIEVLQRSPDRIEPRCPHFGVCAGCVLQHLDQDKQIGEAITETSHQTAAVMAMELRGHDAQPNQPRRLLYLAKPRLHIAPTVGNTHAQVTGLRAGRGGGGRGFFGAKREVRPISLFGR